MTAQFWFWVVLSALGGGIAGWWIRGRQASGRELTIKREFDNRLTTVDHDAQRRLSQARTEAREDRRRIVEERDALELRLHELTNGRGQAPRLRRSKGEPAAREATDSATFAGDPPTPDASRPSRRPRGRRRSTEVGPEHSSNGQTDDLKQIRGIGPAYERLLHEMGYTSFRDVARWGPLDLEQLSGRLGGRGRLHDWISQAGDLHRRKYGAGV